MSERILRPLVLSTLLVWTTILSMGYLFGSESISYVSWESLYFIVMLNYVLTIIFSITSKKGVIRPILIILSGIVLCIPNYWITIYVPLFGSIYFILSIELIYRTRKSLS